MQNLLAPYVGSIPAGVAFFIGLAIASVVTNLASNSVAVIVTCTSFVPAFLSVCLLYTSRQIPVAVRGVRPVLYARVHQAARLPGGAAAGRDWGRHCIAVFCAGGLRDDGQRL